MSRICLCRRERCEIIRYADRSWLHPDWKSEPGKMTSPTTGCLLILCFPIFQDQLATGLVGMRSPYGQPASVFSPDHISGGSSSGSCVSVASGQVSFSLATDTAGSARVPAAFNNIIGFKPTRGTVGCYPCLSILLVQLTPPRRYPQLVLYLAA